MSTVAGRKKSIISAGGVSIDQPVANNSALNKSATVSLYQKCSALRSDLLRIRNFRQYFAIASAHASSRQSTDPVTQLWDCLALGVPLCYLYNLLPPPHTPINVDTRPESIDVDDLKLRKRAIALFVMQMKRTAPDAEEFTVTDLSGDRSSTDGFVKVVNTVLTLVELLPDDVRTEPPSSPPSMATHTSTDSLASSDHTPAPLTSQERDRINICREMVDSERKYVMDLENMQRYAMSLAQSLDQDTIHHLFPNLNKLLNFQRKFLIRFEGIAELPWPEQRWGSPFIETEEEFAVYEPYCAKYKEAMDLAMKEEPNLAVYDHIINAKSELPAFLIKPVQRVCKYPLLLDSLVKAASASQDYPYLQELKDGAAAAKRITDSINEAQRRVENQVTVRALESRVEDWKGHHLSNFGDLLLDDIFMVTKSDVDREYHVFLFEKIILCCKETYQPPQSAKKVGKNNSILRKPQAPPTPGGPNSAGQRRKDSALLLKGRIFLTNVTQAVQTKSRDPPGSGLSSYNLQVWWSGEEDMEFFTLRCRTEEQLRQWESAINRLIKDIAARRASERHSTTSRMNSTNPAPSMRTPSMSYDHGASHSHYGRSPAFPTAPNGRAYRQSNPHSENGYSHSVFSNGSGPAGYPGHDGFEPDGDDDYEDYPPTLSSPPSGRATPMGMRRGGSRSHMGTWEEDPQSFRQSAYSATSPAGPSPSNGLPSGPGRPTSRPSMSRIPSTASGTSYQSDASFGPGAPARPALRSQFSSTRLKTTYENQDSRTSLPAQSTNGKGAHGARSRSASQPSAYVPKVAPPPLPSNGPWNQPPSTDSHKRGSGSSQSTAASSDYSPHTSSSPITPYGSSEGGFEPPVKVKVHFHEDIFVIQVSPRLEFDELVEKVNRKIRLCGSRRDNGVLRVKYRDEDGDMVSLGSTEDVQMAFESLRPGGTVTLFVA